MNDKDSKGTPDPDERAFSGHPDHPPREADQRPQENQELLRNGSEPDRPESDSPENPDDTESTLPGYG